MIVIKIEMWPGGDPARAKLFGECHIVNQQTLSRESKGQAGDYVAKFWGGVYNGRPVVLSSAPWKKSAVKGFDRVGRGAWDLLYLALKAAVGPRA